MYIPISSNILVCLERIERNFTQATCLIDKNDVIRFNKYFLKNFYEYIGCENHEYLKEFVNRHKQVIHPLRRFDPSQDFPEIKHQIQSEILQKLVLRGINSNSIITQINHNHEFKILTEDEFKINSIISNSVVPFERRILEI